MRTVPPVKTRRTVIPPLHSNAPDDVRYRVSSSDNAVTAFAPFNGGIDEAMVSNVVENVTVSLVVEKYGKDGPPVMFIPLADELSIVSTRGHAPARLRVEVRPLDGQWRAWNLDESLAWTPRSDTPGDAVLRATVKQDMANADRLLDDIVAYRFTFHPDVTNGVRDADRRLLMHIHQLSLFKDLVMLNQADIPADPQAQSGPCPSMEFTNNTAEDRTMSAMTEQMTKLLGNTQCDSIFQNNFGTSAIAKLDTSADATFDSEVRARTRAAMEGQAGWGGVSGKAEAEAQGEAKVKANVTAELKSEMRGAMNNDTLSRSTGCEAMTAMARLMTNAQKEATCLMNTLNTTTTASTRSDISLSIEVGGDIIDSTITQTAVSKGTVSVKFLDSSEIGSELTSIMASMLDSTAQLENGMTAKGAFAPSVGAKVVGTSKQQSVSEQARSVINRVITDQLVELDQGTDIRLRVGGSIIGSTITQDAEVSLDLVAGMMVERVIDSHLSSDYMSSIRDEWKSTNKAATEGLSFDFFGTLLAPLIAAGVAGLFLVLGGPTALVRLGGRYLLLSATVVLLGSVVGLAVSATASNTGGIVASAIGLLLGLYLLYKWWTLRSKERPKDSNLKQD